METTKTLVIGVESVAAKPLNIEESLSKDKDLKRITSEIRRRTKASVKAGILHVERIRADCEAIVNLTKVMGLTQQQVADIYNWSHRGTVSKYVKAAAMWGHAPETVAKTLSFLVENDLVSVIRIGELVGDPEKGLKALEEELHEDAMAAPLASKNRDPDELFPKKKEGGREKVRQHGKPKGHKDTPDVVPVHWRDLDQALKAIAQRDEIIEFLLSTSADKLEVIADEVLDGHALEPAPDFKQLVPPEVAERLEAEPVLKGSPDPVQQLVDSAPF